MGIAESGTLPKPLEPTPREAALATRLRSEASAMEGVSVYVVSDKERYAMEAVAKAFKRVAYLLERPQRQGTA